MEPQKWVGFWKRQTNTKGTTVYSCFKLSLVIYFSTNQSFPHTDLMFLSRALFRWNGWQLNHWLIEFTPSRVTCKTVLKCIILIWCMKYKYILYIYMCRWKKAKKIIPKSRGMSTISNPREPMSVLLHGRGQLSSGTPPPLLNHCNRLWSKTYSRWFAIWKG